MHIIFIAPGAGGMYCGSCQRDNTMVRALQRRGHDVTMVPVYTPLRVDGASAAGRRVFFGGIDVYLRQRWNVLRRLPVAVTRPLSSGRFLAAVSRRAVSTDPADLVALTLTMLAADEGHLAPHTEELVAWLATQPPPDVIHISNSLLVGLSAPLSKRLHAPVVCGLQGEDFFLHGLPEPERSSVLEVMAQKAQDVARFVAVSGHAAKLMTSLLSLRSELIDVVPPAVDLAAFGGSTESIVGRRRQPDRKVIGYLARIAPEKGLHLLIEAFGRLHASDGFEQTTLVAAGYRPPDAGPYLRRLELLAADRGVADRVHVMGEVTATEKLRLLRDFDVLCVPTEYPEPRGRFIIEALAAGVPVVAPRHGALSELVTATGGGLLCDPGDPAAIAEALARILDNDDLRNRLAADGQQAVRAEFTAERQAERMERTYAAVL